MENTLLSFKNKYERTMKITHKLSILNFFQFFSWGCWLLSASSYMAEKLHFNGVQIGSVYATLGIASLFMPTLIGFIADKWRLPVKIFMICHFLVVAFMLIATKMDDYLLFYTMMFMVSLFYVPTISLNYSISYSVLENYNLDVVKDFPAIRIWGTIGFILASWIIDLLGWKQSYHQFQISAIASAFIAIYTFVVFKNKTTSQENNHHHFNLESVKQFLNRSQISTFLIFSVLLGSLLQITNIFGVPFINDFADKYPNSFAVKHPIIILSISQISEVIFILAIPSLYKKIGIKWIMVISMIAWAFRFGFFAISSPEGIGLFFLILSMVIYGMAFDFFNISGSIFVEKEAKGNEKNIAQGIFAMATGGFGSLLGAYLSGFVVDFYTTKTLSKDWSSIWTIFSVYALIITLIFTFIFKQKNK